MINKVIKRDGRVVDFDSSKILAAVEKSMKAPVRRLLRAPQR